MLVTSCSVYPDQSLHASDPAELTAGADYKVMLKYDFSSQEKSSTTFPDEVSEFIVRATSPELKSLEELQLAYPSCVPVLTDEQWDELSSIEFVNWLDNNQKMAYLQFSDGSPELAWYVEEGPCKAVAKKVTRGVSTSSSNR